MAELTRHRVCHQGHTHPYHFPLRMDMAVHKGKPTLQTMPKDTRRHGWDSDLLIDSSQMQTYKSRMIGAARLGVEDSC